MVASKEQIVNFLNEQIAQADFRVEAYVFDEENKRRPQRSVFVKMRSYLDSFLRGKRANRWVTLTGLRGAGKTTVLSQLFSDTKEENAYRLFLSLDQTSQLLGASLNDIISAYEDVLGASLESLNKPLLLFLDEVQYDPKWAITLKTIFDRSNKVFIFATGSAALLMNLNTDVARRTVFEKLFPLSFTEYLKIKLQKYEIKGLGKEIREALFSSISAKEVYRKLKSLEKKINGYYLGVSRHEFDKYLNYGSLPFMVGAGNEAIVYDQINKTLNRVVSGDIVSTGKFSSDIISKIPGILYAVADMDAFNFKTISDSFEISRPKVMEIFDLLENAEVLHRVHAHGSHLNQVAGARKPSKFLFSSPAFRAMYYKMIGNIISPENAKGRLLEDLVGMYLHRILSKNFGGSLTYDSAQGGADFILGMGKRRIVIEVGSGQKDYRQVIATAKRVSASYGLVISEDALAYEKEFDAVKVPLKMFLLA
ncbi:MAG: AAA family ATPase [Candidatus Gracilibacteria bacterium]|jgi:hypothetical protein